MRMSDWSSDVCSSDLNAEFRKEQMEENAAREQARLNDVKIAAHEKAIEDLSVAIASRQSTLEAPGAGNYDASNGIVVTAQTDEATRRFSGKTLKELQDEAYNAQQALFNLRTENDALKASLDGAAEIPERSEERRVGNECVRPSRSGWWPLH